MLLRQAERCLIDEAQRITGLPVRTIQSLSLKGEIPGAAKLGKRWTYDIVQLRGWVTACEAAAAITAGRLPPRTAFAIAPSSLAIRERLDKAIARALARGTYQS